MRCINLFLIYKGKNRTKICQYLYNSKFLVLINYKYIISKLEFLKILMKKLELALLFLLPFAMNGQDMDGSLFETNSFSPDL